MIGHDCLLVEKSGDLKRKHVDNESDLYKKCGFKKEDGFEKHAEWKVSIVNNVTYHISLYGKLKGKANTENKYDFPPPADNMLFFGNCILTNKVDGEYDELSPELWDKLYEKLFGGFEDLEATAEEDEKEIDELENIPKSMKTKSGYLKDGFIVDDDEDMVLQQETDSNDTLVDSNSSFESEEEENIIKELDELHLEDDDSELEEEEYIQEEDEDST